MNELLSSGFSFPLLSRLYKTNPPKHPEVQETKIAFPFEKMT